MSGTPHLLFLFTGALLFALGLRGVFSTAPPLRRLLAVNVMSSGVFLVFITLAAAAAGERPDPVPQAMVLTGIVVAVCANGLALVLAGVRRGLDGADGEEGP
jgi:multicomponent Na+:H+ antiporter subunit C